MSNPSPDCPGCGAGAVAAYKPFCSRGCRDRDLIGWFDERHRIPGAAIDPDDAEGLDSRER